MFSRRAFLETTLLLSSVDALLVRPATAVWQNAPVAAEPFFIARCKTWAGVDFRKGESPFPFGLADREIQKIIDRVVTAMHDPDMALPPVPERSVERVGTQIREKVEAAVAQADLSGLTRFGRDWLLAEAVCEYIRMNVRYDQQLAAEQGNQPAAVQIAHSTYSFIFGQDQPKGVCWGIAVSVRDLARAAGLRCDFVNGIYRDLGTPAPAQTDRNHGVVCFTLDGGIVVPADVSSAICDYQNNRKRFRRLKTNSQHVLPRLPEAWELFLATFNGDVGAEMEISGDKQNRHKLLSLTYAEWAAVGTGYLQPLLRRYVAWEEQRR